MRLLPALRRGVPGGGDFVSLAVAASPAGRSLSRRAWLGSALGGLAAAAPIRLHRGAIGAPAPLRPPGVEDERRFLELCVRCGECFKVCPGPVLHPMEWRRGLEALWTPEAIPERAGCHPECNFCGQVCPTGAIPPLPLSEKKRARMGLAKIDASICLPHAGNADCRLCADECRAAGYNAIEMREIQLNVGDVPEGALSMMELEEMARIEAPFVLAEACVGCGLCEYRCHAANVRQQLILDESAIRVYALSNAK